MKNMPGHHIKSNDKSENFLQPQNMLRLYASGAFPMADSVTGKIDWFMPEIRTIIPLDNFNIPRSFRKFLVQGNFEFRFDSDFPAVVKACADREPTWISDELIEAYLKLHKLGNIHTVETWYNGKLIGGLYGVTFKGAFFGESMFSKVPQASKAALVKLVHHLVEKDFVLLDVQYMTEHLKMFGAKEISFKDYSELLYRAYSKNPLF